MKAGPLFLAAGVSLLAVLFVMFKPRPEPAPVSAPPALVTAAPVVPMPLPAAPPPKVFELVVRQGKLVSGPEVLAAREGDAIVLRVTSDRVDEMHLHGYDLEMNLQPNVPGEMKFIANRSGRFEYELHKAHADFGALEVQPK